MLMYIAVLEKDLTSISVELSDPRGPTQVMSFHVVLHELFWLNLAPPVVLKVCVTSDSSSRAKALYILPFLNPWSG